jgi:signal transduction histidine kinase
VAQELHDAVNQSLWGAALTAESLLTELPAGSPAYEKAVKLAALTRGALAEMRSLLIELRPAELGAMPLHELIEHLLTALEARRKLAVEVQLEAVELDEPGHLAFYRIAQEAIGNVAQHAQASSLQVHLTADPRPRLTVIDDGNGFDIGQVPAGHLGLRFMRERADAVGARFAIETGAGTGTTVRVWYPQ